MTERLTAELAVIGGGPGGYAAAFLAADLGMKVTLVDREKNPGGVCLYRGCIPSKALLHVAALLQETREAKNWGVDFGEPKIDLNRLRAWKEEVVAKLTGGLGQLARQRKVQYLQGTARFLDAHSLAIRGADGMERTLRFQHAILATGSRAASLPFLPQDPARIWTSKQALSLPKVPKSLLVIGGGYIGLELGSVYASLGASVTVVEMLPGLLPGADRDLVRVLERRLSGLFKEILLETTVTAVEVQKTGVKVSFAGKNAPPEPRRFDAVLVSVGRKPNTADLGLENTAVQLTEKGFVRVDAQRRTDEPSIYAIGDIAGEPMLAHKASHEGRVAVEAIAGKKVAFEPNAIPAVVFTDPELAWTGLTEAEAKAQGLEVEIVRFPWGASGRATTLGRNDGLTKMVVDRASRRILGVGIVGPGAGELIAEGTLAVEMAALVDDLALTIHAHPTLSETLMEAAESFFGTSTHIYRPKRGK